MLGARSQNWLASLQGGVAGRAVARKIGWVVGWLGFVAGSAVAHEIGSRRVTTICAAGCQEAGPNGGQSDDGGLQELQLSTCV